MIQLLLMDLLTCFTDELANKFLSLVPEVNLDKLEFDSEDRELMSKVKSLALKWTSLMEELNFNYAMNTISEIIISGNTYLSK